jgi:hypothetical protein
MFRPVDMKYTVIDRKSIALHRWLTAPEHFYRCECVYKLVKSKTLTLTLEF